MKKLAKVWQYSPMKVKFVISGLFLGFLIQPLRLIWEPDDWFIYLYMGTGILILMFAHRIIPFLWTTVKEAWNDPKNETDYQRARRQKKEFQRLVKELDSNQKKEVDDYSIDQSDYEL